MICSFITPIFLTHFLSKAEYGLYSQYNTILAFLGGIGTFGLQSNLFYFGADENNQKTYIGNTYLLLQISSFVICLLFLAPPINIFIFQTGSSQFFILSLSIAIFFNIPTSIIYPLFVLKKDKLLSVVYPPLDIILKLLLIIVAALLFESITYIYLAITIHQLILVCIVFIYIFKEEKNNTMPWIDIKKIKEQIKYALPFGLSIIFATIFRQLDKLICIKSISPAEYAAYSLAFFGIPGIQQIYDSVCEVNLMNMSSTYKSGDIDGTIHQYKSFSSKMLSFSVPLICISFLYADQIIPFIFGKQYLESVTYFRIYILSFIIGTIGAGTILRATGRTRLTLWAYLICSPIYITIAIIGIKNYGALGAITSAMVGIILPKFIQISFERRILHVSLYNYMPWKKIATIFFISLFLLVPFIVIKHLGNDSIILSFVFASIYLGLNYIIEIKLNIFLLSDCQIKKFLKQRSRS